jgi:UrcA family protein
MSFKAASLFAAGAASLMVAAGAFASEAPIVQTTRVGFADLNLASDAGVAHLYARLRNASRRVCVEGVFRDMVDAECAARALDGAVAAVHNDKLSAMHARSSRATGGGAG